MKPFIYKSFVLVAVLLTLTACEKPFDELETDPNRATSATAALVFRGVLNDVYGVTGSPWSAEQRWNQFYASNYNYYATNEYSWTTTGLNFFTLKNVLKMEEEAKKQTGTDANVYAALGKFFRAYFFENMTKRVGDIPMTEALKGLESTKPKYDSQKAVYVQVLKWLDDANADLAALIAKNDRALAGDIYLGNDLKKWQKVVNTFKLRVLVSLSKKEGDTDLNIKTRFAEVLANPTKFPVMESMSDNLQYIHNTFNKYPRNPSNFGFNATRENMAKTYVDLLVEREDPRVFVVAEPAEAKLKAGLKATDYGAYVGASSGEDLADMSTKALAGEYSFQSRKRYYSNDVGESVFIIGYPELMFTIAEGINRGWAPGSAEDFYRKGITASMNFYGITDAAALDKYLTGPKVKYAGNTAAGLEQILTQKYIAFFQNSGLEAWYNNRRTGIPTFLTGVGTGNSGRIPKRWLYPNTERVNNSDNYKAAVQSQFSGSDTVNETMWLIK
ncbi:SusD/RagB family nutrient-binding outer membrane lipoprotein [Nibrella viscosa]|uniref:SusD/RagB family nutrient-binding outer membrane lipoprotein n=1 Tax=Nibrella viscosa TaxID=1084524 RepID=A0ABP8KHT5_9BACT